MTALSRQCCFAGWVRGGPGYRAVALTFYPVHFIKKVPEIGFTQVVSISENPIQEGNDGYNFYTTTGSIRL
jgi:hypothetical protein